MCASQKVRTLNATGSLQDLENTLKQSLSFCSKKLNLKSHKKHLRKKFSREESPIKSVDSKRKIRFYEVKKKSF